MSDKKQTYPVKGNALTREIRELIGRVRAGDAAAEITLELRCKEFPDYEKHVLSVLRNMEKRKGKFTVARPDKKSGDWWPFRK